jgi:hypothetical protein
MMVYKEARPLRHRASSGDYTTRFPPLLHYQHERIRKPDCSGIVHQAETTQHVSLFSPAITTNGEGENCEKGYDQYRNNGHGRE